MPSILLRPSTTRIFRPSYGPNFVDLRVCDGVSDANMLDIYFYFSKLILFQEKYFYAIYDMTIRGSCSCYGHADECVAAREEDKDVEGMYQAYNLGM